MRRNQIKSGDTYLAAAPRKAGRWLFEIECLVEEEGVTMVRYTVVQTGQRCTCTLGEFAGRVERKLEPQPIADRRPPR